MFVWFSALWEVGLQFFAFALFGIYAIFARDGESRRHLFIFTIMALFDFFVVIGKLSFLGYGTPAISALTNQDCTGFYFFTDPDEPQVPRRPSPLRRPSTHARVRGLFCGLTSMVMMSAVHGLRQLPPLPGVPHHPQPAAAGLLRLPPLLHRWFAFALLV